MGSSVSWKKHNPAQGVWGHSSVEEYQVGQLYSMAEASGNEMGGGENVKVFTNETYEKNSEKGHYTHTQGLQTYRANCPRLFKCWSKREP